jgi:hypothetical protein
MQSLDTSVQFKQALLPYVPASNDPSLMSTPFSFPLSGIQKHITLVVAGIFIGEWMWNSRQRFFAEKDLQYYHYMTLHPEDFPKPRKLYVIGVTYSKSLYLMTGHSDLDLGFLKF